MFDLHNYTTRTAWQANPYFRIEMRACDTNCAQGGQENDAVASAEVTDLHERVGRNRRHGRSGRDVQKSAVHFMTPTSPKDGERRRN